MGNDYFTQPAFIKPVVLDEWSMKRIQMPERAYKKFFFCKFYCEIITVLPLVKQKPFNYGASHTREFGTPDELMLGEGYREVLQDTKKRFIDFVERPQKYMPEPKEPLCLERTTKFFKQDPINKPFGYSTHTSWEAFQHTMRTTEYQTTLRGGSF